MAMVDYGYKDVDGVRISAWDQVMLKWEQHLIIYLTIKEKVA